jgi:PAS domain S-box-containing protein
LRNKPLVMAAGLLWILACGIIDWLTGTELASSAFYLPGVAVVGWHCGRSWGVAVALSAALAWLLAELAGKVAYSTPLVPYWNASVRLAVFVITAVLVSEVRIRRVAESALREQRGILSSILESMKDGVVVVNGVGRIIVFNSAARTMLGGDALHATQTTWLGRLEELSTDEHAGRNRSVAPLRNALASPTGGEGEIVLQGVQGGARYCAFNVRRLEDSGKLAQSKVVVLHDLTTRRLFEKRLVQAAERAQHRIAQDLHDGLSQHLVSVAFAADELQGGLSRGGEPVAAAKAGEIATLVRQAIGQAKSLARGLYPSGLEESLATALQNLALTVESRSGVACGFTMTGPELPLAPETAGNLFRIAQESVTNALRHASPKGIGVRLEQSPEVLVLEVTDDGTGIRQSAAGVAGIGLQIIRHRANLIGADLQLESLPGAGTTVRCTLPLPA